MNENKKINDLVLLVGGLGTRLSSVVSDVPKPMAPVQNKPFLEYILEYWSQKGINNFHLLIGYKGYVIEKYFGSKFKKSNIYYYPEEKLAGTGGSLKLFLLRNENDNVDKNYIVINGDTWLDVDFNILTLDNEKSNDKTVIAVKEISYNDRYGTLKICDQNVLEMLPPNHEKSFINSGLYILNPKKVLKYFLKQNTYNFSFETKILPLMIREKTVYASFCINNFLDIGIPQDYVKTIDIFK